MKRYWKWLAVGIGVIAVIIGIFLYMRSAPPKLHQEVADALAEYGWIVIDLKVDELHRTIQMVVIPPEDEEQYIAGFFYLLEWAEPIIRPPVDNPIEMGIYPGVLVVGEVTDEPAYVVLANGKLGEAYGLKRLWGFTWPVFEYLLGEGRQQLHKANDVHSIAFVAMFYRMGYYSHYTNPVPLEPLEDGWYQIPEKPEEPTSDS